jgi:hypothetical protein
MMGATAATAARRTLMLESLVASNTHCTCKKIVIDTKITWLFVCLAPERSLHP